MANMKMDIGLQVRQSQSLIMTPQLQQAIKLLQLSRYELEQLIEQTLIENPALETLQPGDDGDSANFGQDETQADKQSEADEELWDNASEESYLQNEIPSNQPENQEENTEWDTYISDAGGTGSEDYAKSSASSEEDQRNILENTITRKESLASYLLWQINMMIEDDEEKKVAGVIVSFIDNDGYLIASLREIAAASAVVRNWAQQNSKRHNGVIAVENAETFDMKRSNEKNNRRTSLAKKLIKNVRFEGESDDAEPEYNNEEPVDLADIPDSYCALLEKVLNKIQRLDPSGVGARNIRECLLIQLEALSMEDTLPYQIVCNDFQNLIRNDIHRLNRKYDTSFDDILSACRIIRDLEPKPGRPFFSEATQYVIPDVFIYKHFGSYKVRLNQETLPRLRVSPYYLEMAKQQHIANQAKAKEKNSDGDDDLTEAYLNEKIRAGEWLIKSIDQRQRTIYKVAESILKNQRDFFENGISELKPMILRVVADDIGVHESTVSRITNNKFVHTPQGIFELKFFFTSGVTQDDGDSISSKKIKDLISRLIQSESPKKPYTDHQLSIELEKTEKIKIARRTVAKYRESMNILPSNRRKRLF